MSEFLKYLQTKADAFELMGYPSLLERFILRKGQHWVGATRLKRMLPMRECFKNSLITTLTTPGYKYVEGLAIRPQFACMPIHHAWLLREADNTVVETTWRLEKGEKAEYVGVVFEADEAARICQKQGYYGLLANEIFFNTDLIFSIDPELKDVVKQITQKAFNEE